MGTAGKMALSFAAGALAATALLQARGPQGSLEQAKLAASLQDSERSLQSARESAPASLAGDAGPPAPPETARPAAKADPAERQLAERAQVVQLQARVRELEQRAAASASSAEKQRPKFHDLTDAELQAMAQNCEVRFDLPRLRREPFQLPPDLGSRLHLSEAEQAKVSAAVDAVSKDVIAHLRALYLEATSDAAGADTLEPETLMREILEKSPPAAVKAAQAEIARERAGMPPSPSNTIAERYLRYITTVGDSLQRALEPSLGAQQAAATRDALAASTSMMSGCAR